MTKTNQFDSIRNKLLAYALSIVFLMTIISLYSLNIIDQYKDQMHTMFQGHLYLSNIEQELGDIQKDLLGFLSYKSSTKLNDYNIKKEELRKYVKDQRPMTFGDHKMLLTNIENLIDSYFIQADQSITYKRQRNVNKYYNHYLETEKIQSYIVGYITKLNNEQLGVNSLSYQRLADQIPRLESITYFIVMTTILLSVIGIYLITSNMVKPISALSQAAEEVGKGNLTIDDVQVETEDEFKLLAMTFNKMKNSIKIYIEDLNQKAETEAKLKDEQMKNVKMEHLLDNARLYALQSQMNPHFLFNTINAGVQLSIMEGAFKTSEFFDTMSRVFRYNIQKMGASVALKEEVKNIEDYYELLKVRFGDRIQFDFDIDKESLELEMPPLILQPLVENAYIHGLSSLEEGGSITLKTWRQGDMTYISIHDTGVGIEEERMNSLLYKNKDNQQNVKREDHLKESSNTKKSSIGLRNVRDRLQAFYKGKNIFSIESEKGQGTTIIIGVNQALHQGGHHE